MCYCAENTHLPGRRSMSHWVWVHRPGMSEEARGHSWGPGLVPSSRDHFRGTGGVVQTMRHWPKGVSLPTFPPAALTPSTTLWAMMAQSRASQSPHVPQLYGPSHLHISLPPAPALLSKSLSWEDKDQLAKRGKGKTSYKFINEAMGPQKATVCSTNGLETKVRVKLQIKI